MGRRTRLRPWAQGFASQPHAPSQTPRNFIHGFPPIFPDDLHTFQRRRYCVSEDVVEIVRSTFFRTGVDHGFAIPAYCFMPEHLHMLAEAATTSADLRIFINMAKQRSAYEVHGSVRGRLWQAGYFDRVLRQEDDLFAVARYIVQNPVRAGLARTPVEYSFCGSTMCSKDELVESTIWCPGAP